MFITFLIKGERLIYSCQLADGAKGRSPVYGHLLPRVCTAGTRRQHQHTRLYLHNAIDILRVKLCMPL